MNSSVCFRARPNSNIPVAEPTDRPALFRERRRTRFGP